jgi:CRP-like cAMP-binding protein
MSMVEDHRANRLVAALEPDDFSRLAPHLEVVSLPRGRILYETGESIEFAYFPHDCIISLVAILEDGGSVEMAVFGCEAVLGFASAIITRESLGRYITQVPGTASRIEVERLHEAFATSPKIRQLMLRYFEVLLAQTFQTVACNAVHSVEARCCRWILSTHDRVTGNTLPLTHEFLAEMLGVQRSTVSITTRTLQNAGLIMQRRGVIMVEDRAGLEEVACECYRNIRQRYKRLLPATYLLR